MSTQSGETIWAKRHGLDSSYPLIRHLLDTAAIAEQLFHTWLRPGLQEQITQALGAEAPRIVAAIAGIHDIGKANPLFQGQLAQSGEVWQAVRDQIAREENVDFPPAARSNRWAKLAALRRHEQVSALSLSDIRLDELTTGEAWHILPALGHHGFFRLPLSNSRDRRLDSATVDDCLNFPGWKEKREEISAQFYDALGIDHGTLPEQAPVTVGLLLSGLTVLADRLASHTNWVQRSHADLQQSTIPANDYAGWFAAQKSHAPAHIKQFLGIYEGWPSQEAAQDAILGPGREPYEVQRLTRDNDAGLVAVMSATGSGKTEAALLRHARRHERLLFLLPTQATTNALMRRVQKAYSSTSNVASLAHSLASIEDFYTTPVTSFDDSTDHAEPSMQQNEGLSPHLLFVPASRDCWRR
ncbi:CRISPR-associated endonuclease Cas3'' [Corynebacterium propinquum]|uniref:CRISPR-associated endonuclease Cas3'' n=1 Tax=Corynebacterium propinquum TaxID=43769 RepID=UPI00119D9002|nr:CRISPR-associated endonuclease Cas3'' [Corynebacterium propinquum]WKS49745.1 CRISPR-associated endonuclease Cas3'' [Corynebacterium propinquum]